MLTKMLLWNRAYGRDKEELHLDTCAGLGCCYENLSKSTPPKNLVLSKESQISVIDALLYSPDTLSECQCYDNMKSDEDAVFRAAGIGPDALKAINGDFSGAVYDKKEHTLTLFRDHMGIRPLFYYTDDTLTAFSTDIRALLALDAVDACINEEWLYRTCIGYYMDGLKATEYQHIFCVRPASCTTFRLSDKSAALEENIYWRPGSKKIRLSSFENYKKLTRKLVQDSIEIRLKALKVPIGAELSGGLDSGVIDILIHRLGHKCLYHSWSADPCRLPYAQEDERLVIRDICSQEGVICHFSDLCPDYGMNSRLAKTMQDAGFILDPDARPVLRYAMPPYINTLSLSNTSEYMHSNGVKVIFTGHGGDEGISHRCNPYELFYHHEYYHFFRQLWLSVQGQRHRPIRFVKKCRRILGNVRRQFYTPFQSPFCDPKLLKKEFAEKFSRQNMPLLHFAYSPIEYIEEGGSRNRLDNTALQGAYNGVRYICPYLDYRVIDFAVSIPRYLYLNGTQNRYLFREAFRDLMPESLYRLQSKEDVSGRNIPDNPNWFEEFQQRRDEINRKLNRKIWEKYLNFDYIDNWMQKDRPSSEEERQHDSSLLMCLLQCAMAQNAVEKARSAAEIQPKQQHRPSLAAHCAAVNGRFSSCTLSLFHTFEVYPRGECNNFYHFC